LTSNEQPGAWFLDALAKGGVDTQELSRRLPGQVDLALRFPTTITPAALNSILSEAASLSGDRNFGLRMVDLVTTSDLGLFGYLMTNAPTVKEALEVACRYYPTFYRGATLELSTVNGTASIIFRPAGNGEIPNLLDNEWTLGSLVKLIRRGASADWSPTRTTFPHPAPEDLAPEDWAELNQVFGPNIHFDHENVSIEFPVDILGWSINDADPDLLRVLLQHADRLLAEIHDYETLAGKVRLMILEHLGSGKSDEAVIARDLSMSVSTLKRRLKHEGCTYRKLRDDVVEAVSKKALRESQAPISEIASRVGYSEASAFDRAFERVAGMSPKEYRARASRKFQSK
jgi:AraC-like DNA-binding protein